MTGEGLEKDVKNLQEQNMRLQEEVDLLKVEQCSILRRIEAIEEVMRNKPVQVDKGVSAVPEGSSDDDSYTYSPVNSPAKCMPPLYQTPSRIGHFPPTYLPPSIASSSHLSPAYMSQPVPHFPPPLPYHTSPVAKCNPVKPKKNANNLPSAAIIKEALISPSQAFAKYHKLLVVSKAPTLATKLARDVFFGTSVLRRCTVMGCREQPGLPVKELNELKEAMFTKFPQYWANPVDFEEVWAQCVDAIGQLCKRLRKSSGDCN